MGGRVTLLVTNVASRVDNDCQDGYPDLTVQQYTWFIILMFGLKLPVIGIGYFIYRMLKAGDEQWESGGYDGGWGDDGGGGGGGPRVPRPPGPSGSPLRRRRKPPRPVLPERRVPMLDGPLRRPAPVRTGVRTERPVRTRP
jgi:hypothetical protein